MTKTPRFDWGRTGGFRKHPRSPQVTAGQRVSRSPGLGCGMRWATAWCEARRAGPAGPRCIVTIRPFDLVAAATLPHTLTRGSGRHRSPG